MRVRNLLLAALALLAIPGLATAQVDTREGIYLQNQIQELKRDIQALRDAVNRGTPSGTSTLGANRTPAPAANADVAATSGLRSTVDTAEVRKFAAQASAWWRLDGPFAGLHRMNAVRVPLVRGALAGACEGRRGGNDELGAGAQLARHALHQTCIDGMGSAFLRSARTCASAVEPRSRQSGRRAKHVALCISWEHPRNGVSLDLSNTTP